MAIKKTRLDIVLVDKGLASSRQRAHALVRSGKVLVNDESIDKPGTLIHPNDHVRLKEGDVPYASRGGVKLETALRTLDIDVTGSICLDVGASTGGFTDCLLQHGAHKVFAVDVGYGQLAWKLRQDPRVFVLERTNIRYLEADALPHPVDFITIDVSFISLKIVVPTIVKFMKKETKVLALIKPQFEVGKDKVGKGGVVRDQKLHSQVIADLTEFFVGEGLLCQAVLPSPILGPKGNKEFFIFLKHFD